MSQNNSWSFKLYDGSSNQHRLQYPETPNYFYRGVRPIQSCSGFYSGGPDVDYNFTQQQAKQIQNLCHNLMTDAKNHTKQQRIKGTFLLQDNHKKQVLLNGGQQLQKLKSKLEVLKAKGNVHPLQQQQTWSIGKKIKF